MAVSTAPEAWESFVVERRSMALLRRTTLKFISALLAN